MGEMIQRNRKAIGRRIGQVRRWAAVSQLEFARTLQVPTMLTEIAEHGIKEADGAEGEGMDIPANDMIHLLALISNAYKVSYDWLLSGKGAPTKLDETALSSADELTLYFPATISEQSLIDELNRVLISMDTNPYRGRERVALQRESLESIIQKYSLYEQHAAHAGNRPCANRARSRMLTALDKALYSRAAK